jgi:hypothetical protein
MGSADEALTRLVRQSLRHTRRARIRVRGTSMLPAIQPSAVVTIEDRPFTSVRPGQIVAYVHDDGIVVHRMVGRASHAHLLTLGDNLPLYDPPVPEAAYLGVLPDYAEYVPDRTARLPEPSGPPAPCEVITWAPYAESPISEPGGIRIGVSPSGALPAQAVPRILAAVRPRRVHVLVGWAFGDPRLSTPEQPVLPPGVADFHVRMGEPLQDIDPASAIRRIAAWATSGGNRRPLPRAEVSC